jgi:predicted acylesterase/phospholipase RssA
MKWRALILGGGGSTGEFQIGALKVLSEKFNTFDFFVGLGCGSLNCTVLAQHESLRDGYDILLKVWDDIKKTSDILDPPLLGEGAGFLGAMITDQSWGRQSVYGNKTLRKIIEQHIDWNALKPKNNWAIEATSLTDGQPYTITSCSKLLEADTNPYRQLKLSLDPSDPYDIGPWIYDFIEGAGCVPIMLPPVDVFNHRFVEGGVRHFTPLQLAVLAFEQNRTSPNDVAEFYIVNNYLGEPQSEEHALLDTGLEISMRAIKLMTMVLAQHDLEEGQDMLNAVGDGKSKVIVLEPSEDFRLNPMNFDDLPTRTKLRDHGISVATEVLGDIPDMQDIANAHLVLQDPLANPDTVSDAMTKILHYHLWNPEAAFTLRESIAPHAAEALRPARAIASVIPTTLPELKDAMKQAKANGQRIKAIGADYAFSEVLDTDGIQISMQNLNDISPTDHTVLKDPTMADNLIEFEAGATIDQLTTALWAQDKALLNQPGYEKLSYVGVASCGGHGSGIALGPLTEEICAIHLLTFEDGELKQLRLEPTNGITDPVEFGKNGNGFELRQDNDTFNAVKVSMGCMGVIYSVIVRTQPSFYLEELRTMRHWSELRNELPAKLADATIHSIHVWLNPYEVNGDHSCVLTEYRRTTKPATGTRGFGATFIWDKELAPLLLWIMKNFPDRLGPMLDSSLGLMVDDGPVIMPCYEALNFGMPNEVHVEASNCGIPAVNAIDAADKLFALFHARFATGAYVTCPPGFRFTNSTDALLAPQHGHAACMIELPLVFGTTNSMDTLSAFHDTLWKECAGRPHWGQRLSLNFDAQTVRDMYPTTFSTFASVFNQLNDGTFDGPLTERLKLRNQL